MKSKYIGKEEAAHQGPLRYEHPIINIILHQPMRQIFPKHKPHINKLLYAQEHKIHSLKGTGTPQRIHSLITLST